jgi:membrane-bound serine protease (ClpP class)
MIRRLPDLPHRLSLCVALLGLILAVSAGAGRAAGPEVVQLTADGVVDSVMASYIADGVAGAGRSGAAAVVIELNTPGGSLDATTKIKAALLEARVPTIVWVAPAGGRAASAGTFITLAANLAYMAPGTNIGAASPVDASGGDIPGTLGVKVRNDAIASITAIAEARGRPVDWAVATVRDARSSPASEAVAVGAVDGIADSIDAVLAAANGHSVTVAGRTFSLELASATVREAPMNPFQGFLHLLSDPNIAFVLFVIGLIGIVIEFFHTNLVTGIVGAIALILAFIGFGSLPLNVAGLILVALGVGMFILETQITSHGLLTAGGIAAFALGASALYTTPLGDPTQPMVQVAPPVIIVTTGTTAILMVLVTYAAIRTRHMASTAGTVGVRIPIGTLGVVQAPLAPVGTAHLAGEAWSARTADSRPLPRETQVRLVGFDGLTAIVEPVDNGPSATPAAPASADRP